MGYGWVFDSMVVWLGCAGWARGLGSWVDWGGLMTGFWWLGCDG